SQQLLQADRLLVGRVREGQGGADRGNQRVDLEAAFGGLGGGTDEALVPRQLAQGLTPDAPDGVGQGGVAEAPQDGGAVVGELAGIQPVLDRQQGRGLLQGRRHLRGADRVFQGLGDRLVAGGRTEVRRRRVPGVDGEELALDVRREVVDEV